QLLTGIFPGTRWVSCVKTPKQAWTRAALACTWFGFIKKLSTEELLAAKTGIDVAISRELCAEHCVKLAAIDICFTLGSYDLDFWEKRIAQAAPDSAVG